MATFMGDRLPAQVWKSGPRVWLATALAGIALLAAFFDTLRFMMATWVQVEEYSYGWFIPVICAFLVWQKSDRLRQFRLDGAWGGLWLVLLALALRLLGEFSAIRLFSQYGFIVGVFGLSVCAIGWRGTRLIAMPLGMLVFMIPLPQFLLRELSENLQLLSSALGVALIRAFDISVFLEGNVIDLGSYKLQVVEACNGLRYLFPLMVLGFLAAYFFQGALWKKALIVLSTVPLTIVINSLRIGLIGISVELWGKEMAEGLLHDFEGWFMFLVCIALLVGEMALLARLGPRGVRLRSVFGLDLPAPAAHGSLVAWRQGVGPLIAGALLLAALGAYALLVPPRVQISPARTSFNQFPLQLGPAGPAGPAGEVWQGRTDRLEPEVLATLALDDYFIANYVRPGQPWVNFYSAYYASQSGGESTHSPRTCIPGGGWSISSLDTFDVPLALPGAAQARLAVNRAIIQKGDSRQLAYYWFRQRGRSLTNEFAVKWYILRDGLLRSRSDGALLRLVTPIVPGENPASADRRLAEILSQLEPRLPAYVPD